MKLWTRFRPTIAHKGLALVFVPLVLQTAFLWRLADLVGVANRMAEEEKRQSEVVEHINAVIILFANATGSIGSYLMTGAKQYKDVSVQLTEQVNSEYDELTRLLADDKIAQDWIVEMRGLTEAQMKELQEMTPASKDQSFTDVIMQISNVRKLIKQGGARGMLVLDQLQKQRGYLEEIRTVQEQSRRSVENIIAAGVVGNFVLALMLSIWFTRNINRRLNVLVENAQRLPRRLPLNKTVSGSDELFYLDSVMHEAAAELAEADRHRQSLMQMVAHDLRSPLMSSQISLELLSEQFLDQLPGPAHKQVDAANRNITRVMQLVNDLLTIDSLEAGKLELNPEPTDVRLLVEEALQSVGGLAKQKRIALENEAESFNVSCDRQRVMQVLMNYLSNAIKFAPNDSTIKAAAATQNDKVIVSVIDEGPGLGAEEIDQVFEKYYQTEDGKTRKGFGLGLAICKLIVERHRGEVGVRNNAEKGCTFWFSLPAR